MMRAIFSPLENLLSGIAGVNIYWQEILKALMFITVVAINTAMAAKAGKS